MTKDEKMDDRHKPGRLTDDKWWFCKIGQHDKCADKMETNLWFEGCPCECHLTAASSLARPAPEPDGEWRVIPEPVAPALAAIHANGLIIASCMTTETAAQIVADHRAVSSLVAALQFQRRALVDLVSRHPRLLPLLADMRNDIDAALRAAGREEG